MSLPGGSPVLTLLSGCDMDLLGVGNCLQMWWNINYIVTWSNSGPMSLCNRLYTGDHLHHWCGSEDLVQCSCSHTQQPYCSKDEVYVPHLAPKQEFMRSKRNDSEQI